MTPGDSELERGRRAFERGAWKEAHAALTHVEAELGPPDRWRLAVASYLLGREADCSVIGACREVWALGRAQEWTTALAAWCDSQPDMVPYAGECRVYRAEILQMHGDRPSAFDEARRAVEHFSGGWQPRVSARFGCFGGSGTRGFVPILDS